MIELIWGTFTGLFAKPFRWKLFIQQIHFIGNGSLIIVLFCVSFAAMVTILESSFHMKLVIQNNSMVPGFAAMLILRELAAVVTALLVTSRVGAGITAEVGSMKITEQIEALQMLGINPYHYLSTPRWLAGIIGMICLGAVANVVCLMVAMFVSQNYLGFTPGMFLSSMNRFVDFQDLIFSLIKCACFGAVIPLVSCYWGFRCEAGAEGVGSATTSSVVTSSVFVIGLDFVLSFIFTRFY